MTIFELKEKIEETKSDIKSLEREIKRNRESLEPRATEKKKKKVSGGGNGRTIDDVMSIILEAEKCIQRCQNKLDDYYIEVREKEEIFNKYNDKDKQLYIDKKIYKLNNAQLEIKYGIGKRGINKKISKMEKNSK